MSTKKRNETPEPRGRATDAEMAARVEETLHVRLNGGELYDLRGYAAEKGWNVSDRQLRRYMEQADELLAEVQEKDREKIVRRHLAQRRALFARAVNDGDSRTALAVLKDEAELEGLYPGRKVELTGRDGGPVQVESLTDDERRAALERILTRFGPAAGSAGRLAADRNGHAQADG